MQRFGGKINGLLCFFVSFILGCCCFQLVLLRCELKRGLAKQPDPPAFTDVQAVELCTKHLLQRYPNSRRVTIAGKPKAELEGGTWLVVGLVDVPLESKLLERSEWACGVTQDGKTVQFVTVMGGE